MRSRAPAIPSGDEPPALALVARATPVTKQCELADTDSDSDTAANWAGPRADRELAKVSGEAIEPTEPTREPTKVSCEQPTKMFGRRLSRRAC